MTFSFLHGYFPSQVADVALRPGIPVPLDQQRLDREEDSGNGGEVELTPLPWDAPEGQVQITALVARKRRWAEAIYC